MDETKDSVPLIRELVLAGFELEEIGKATKILSRRVPQQIIEASELLTNTDSSNGLTSGLRAKGLNVRTYLRTVNQLEVLSVLILLAVVVAGACYVILQPRQFVKASTIEISRRVLTARFTMPDGNWVEVSKREGGAIKVKNLETGETFLLALAIRDERTGSFWMNMGIVSTVFSNGKANGESVDKLRPVDLTGGKGLMRLWGRPVQIEVHSSMAPGLDVGGGGDECCVICDGVSFCACSVRASCGSCCISGCC